jgi:cytochrome c-type biogenesis protein
MHADVTWAAAFLAGLISFVSPCVLPLVPPYLCYLAGTTMEEASAAKLGDRQIRRRVLLAAVGFVLGFATVFVMLGAAASVIGQVLRENLSILGMIAGIVIIVMGLHFLGVFRIPLMYREARIQSRAEPVGVMGSYLMGLAFAFGWTPCIGPVLAAILAVAASRETVGEGMGLLAVYSAGLGVPFLLAGFGMEPLVKLTRGMRGRFAMVEKAMGGLLVVTGVLFLTGTMTTMSFWLLETFPALGRLG